MVKNNRRDADQQVRDGAFAQYRAELAGMRAGATLNPDTLNQLIRSRRDHREFLLAALEHDGIAPALLDTLARSSDITIVRKAADHRSASPATLARVYRASSYPPYFYQALASNANTPVEILREIHRKPGPMSGLAIWFAGNASTPRDIVDSISRTSDNIDAIRVLLRRPTLDCALVTRVAAGPALAKHPADDYSVTRIRELRETLCR